MNMKLNDNNTLYRIVSICLSLLITLIFVICFSSSLFLSKKAVMDVTASSYTHYSVEMNNFYIDNDSFISNNNEAVMEYNANDKIVNYVNVLFNNELNDSCKIKVEYTNGEQTRTKNITLEKGMSKVSFSILETKLTNIKLLFSGDSISIKNIQFSHHFYDYTRLRNIFIILCVFFLTYVCISVLWKKNKECLDNHFIHFFNNYKYFLILLVIIISIFVILYHKFIFYGQVYAFGNSDIGGDTLDIYYAVYYRISQQLHNGSLSFFDLSLGFGSSIFSVFGSFTLFELFIVLFPPEKVYIGIIISTFFKYICIAIFSYKLFDTFFKNKKTVISISILWSFSSYIVGWGQHYKFATMMVMFTIFVYYLNEFVNNRNKPLQFIIAMSLSVIGSFYFFWMFGVFSIIYILVVKRLQHEKYIGILKNIFQLGIMAIISVMLAAVLLFPALYIFLESARISSISSASSFNIVKIKSVVTFVGRFLTSNFLGGGWFLGENYYSGIANYYEAPFLSTSILIIFAMSYIVVKAENIKSKVKRLLCFILMMLPLFYTGTNYLFCLTTTLTYRWTYIYVFAFCIFIGYFIDDFLEKKISSKQIKKICLLSGIFFSICISLLLVGCFLFKYAKITISQLLIVLITFVIFTVFILMKNKIRNVSLILVAFIIIESIVSNYPTINERGFVSINQLENDFYSDGTTECIADLKEDDSTLYRINKEYTSKFLNDSYVQNYFGLSVYKSQNSQNLYDSVTQTFQHYPYDKKATNYITIDTRNKIDNGLLGVKYIFQKDSKGNISYKLNDMWLPFGIMYDNQVNVETFEENPISRLFGYSLTDSSNKVTENQENNYLPQQFTNLLSIEASANHCLIQNDGDSLMIDSIDNDPQIVYEVPINQNSNYAVIEMEVYSKEYNTVQIYYSDSKDFSEENSIAISNVGAEKKKVICTLPSDFNIGKGKLYLRIDPMQGAGKCSIKKLQLNLYNKDKINSQLNYLRENSFQNVNYDGNLSGTITNDSQNNKMLFIPIINSQSWNAYVDGKKVTINNVNGNFIGIRIGKGKHIVELKYVPVGLKSGLCLSILTLGVLIILKKIKYINQLKYQ